MPSKTCPNCGHHYTIKSFLRLTTYRFRCHHCRVELKGNMRFFILGALFGASIMAFSISKAICNPVWWLLVPAAMVANFFIYYWLFGVALFHAKS